MDLLHKIQQRTKDVTLGKDDAQPLAGPCPLVNVHVLDGSGGILTVGEGWLVTVLLMAESTADRAGLSGRR